MINYIEKSNKMHTAIDEAGYYLIANTNDQAFDQAGNQSVAIDEAVQAIIDSFDPLPESKSEAKTLVKEASATKRLEYVTQAAGKDAEYTFKAQEATQFNLDSSVGVFMQARIDATGETAATVATEWNAKSVAWQAVGASIAAIEDKSSQDIDAETDWQQCDVIAKAALVSIEAI